jgi:L-asparaginase
MINATPSFQVGGTLDPRVSVYVKRPEDDEFIAAASAPKAWINIHGCRTMGKSSLYTQYVSTLASRGIVTIVIDVAAQVGKTPKTAAEWFCALGEAWTSDLSIQSVVERSPGTTPTENNDRDLLYEILDTALKGLRSKAGGAVAGALLSRALLTQCPGRVLLVLDEYDYIQELPYCDDILFALRHIQSVQARSQAFEPLSVCLVGLQPVFSFGRAGAANTSPICRAIEMRDFGPSPVTLDAFQAGFSRNDRPDEKVLLRVLEISGGQPLVTMQLLSEVKRTRCRTPAEVQNIADELVAVSGKGKDLQVFQAIENAVSAGSEGNAFAAVSAYKGLLDGSTESHTAPGIDLLLLYGLLKRIGERLEIKGSIFRRRFDRAWAERMLRVTASSSDKRSRGNSRTPDKRICVINAGGTLGMVQRDGQVVPPRDAAEFKAYFTSLDTIANTIEFINLFPPRDSINVFPGQWTTIARYIYERRNEGFDGFVVAHGTDTMAYTASAVAFALGPQLRFPVVFTGAQTTPDVAYGDAHVNLYRACEVAKKTIPEVVISFGNFVYRAVRAQKRDDRRFDGFESPTYPPLAEITGEINVRAELLRPLPETRRDIELRAEFERSILIVPQFPGLEPAFFAHLLDDDGDRQRCRGVIVQTLGAGNVTNEAPYSFIPFVERAYRRGIPVIVTSQYPPDPGTHTKYTPAQAPIEAGAIHAGNMTLAAAVTKFRWVLAHVRRRKGWRQMPPKTRRELVSRLMVEQSIVGEF